MANRYAVADGNWSDLATWDGGLSIPSPGDDVRANNHTVVIDQDVDVSSVGNGSDLGQSSEGSFHVNAIGVGLTRTISANVIGQDHNDQNLFCVEINANDGTLVWNGRVGGHFEDPAGQNRRAGVVVNGNCDLVWNGNLYGGDRNSHLGLSLVGGGDIIVNGDCYPGNADNADAVRCQSTASGSLTINGDVYGPLGSGNSSSGVYHQSTFMVVDINGELRCQSGFIPGNAGCFAVTTGNSSDHGPLRILGPIRTHDTYPVHLIDAGGGFITPEGNDLHIELFDDADPPTKLTIRVLPGGDYPTPADVRDGTSYNINEQSVGTLKVPPPEAVSYGAETDNTVGTAAVDLPTIAAVIGAQIAAANDVS